MRRISLLAKFAALLLLFAFTAAQAMAAAHHCPACPQHDAECVEYLSSHDSAAPDARAGWPQIVILADASRTWFISAFPSTRAAPGPRVNSFPDARNVSIVQLNQRQ